MGPSNTSFLSFRVIFHFYDLWRKGNTTTLRRLVLFEYCLQFFEASCPCQEALGPMPGANLALEEFCGISIGPSKTGSPKAPGCIFEAR